MESRNITLTLDKAEEWFNSGNEELREAALRAYTEKELATPEWEKIKTFEDACKVLNIKSDAIFRVSSSADSKILDHLYAIYKLDIIHRALNKDWKPSLVQGNIYYSYVRLYSDSQEAREAVSENKGWKLGESFIADGKKYTLVGGDCSHYACEGLTSFNYESGNVLLDLGLLGCKNREIAKHMSRYFSRELFEATYSNTIEYRFLEE